MIAYLKKKLRHYLLRNDHSAQFYSQGGEDAILYGIFLKKLQSGKKGFFIDVGAYHPIIHSNTYRLYLNGWRGINIDANPGSMKPFRKQRPQDLNLEIGVGLQNELTPFYILGANSTMNSFSKENLEVHGMGEVIATEVVVQMKTLESLLDEHLEVGKKIDLLNVDVEGFDNEVLKSNNWNKYLPGVVIVEIACRDIDDVKENQSARLLLDLNYNIVAKNVLKKNLASVFFVHKDYEY